MSRWGPIPSGTGCGIASQTLDRTELAAFYQAYGRWVEAEKKLAEARVLLKTPAVYVQ